jgi:endogenous inhibitor of DNA gyrase (YacG/DUF329 family)
MTDITDDVIEDAIAAELCTKEDDLYPRQWNELSKFAELQRQRERQAVAVPSKPDNVLDSYWQRAMQGYRFVLEHGFYASPPADTVKPIPVNIKCPECGTEHIDEDEWATRPHKTHQCQQCKHEWRPFEYATVGVADTVKPRTYNESFSADPPADKKYHGKS